MAHRAHRQCPAIHGAEPEGEQLDAHHVDGPSPRRRVSFPDESESIRAAEARAFEPTEEQDQQHDKRRSRSRACAD